MDRCGRIWKRVRTPLLVLWLLSPLLLNALPARGDDAPSEEGDPDDDVGTGATPSPDLGED